MRRILILFVVVFGSFFTHSQTPTYTVGFLLDKINPEIEGLLDGLETEIIRVVGEDAIVEFSKANRLVNDFNNTKAKQNYDKYVSDEIDIIIAFGVVNNNVIANETTYPKPTIVFGSLSKELLKGQDISPTSQISNYTSIITSQSYTEDLKLLQQLADPKSVAIIVEKPFAENQPLEETFDEIGTALDLDLTILPFETLEDIITGVDSFDAAYMAGGFYLNDDEIVELADSLIVKKIPSFTNTPAKDVELGIMATSHDQSEINQFFRRIALSVETVVNGGNLSDVPTQMNIERVLTVNFNTADKIGVPLKYSLIASTNFIGNPEKQTAEKKYNLVEVMREAIAENLNLQTFRQEVQLNEQDVRFAKSDYIPDINVSASGSYVDPALAEASNGQNPEFTTNGNLTLNQLVFSNDVNANISIQKALQMAQQENYNSEELNTVFSAAQAYFDALILKANTAIQGQNLELTKYNLKIAEQNFEAGQSGKSDVLRFRSEMAQNTQEMIEAVNRMEQSFNALNQILNNSLNYKIDVDEAELEEGIFSNYSYKTIGVYLDDPRLRQPFIDFLVQEGIANAPELRALDYNIQAAERSEILYGRGRFLPDIGLQGQYNQEFSRSGVGTEFPPIFTRPPEGYYTVGLSVTLPIINQNKQNINKQIASIQKEQLNTTVGDVKLNIERNVNDGVLQLVNQISNIQLSEVSERTAEEALELTQTSYANGAVNIVQLLDAQNNYLQAQLSRTNAVYNYLLSSLQLERYLGQFFLLQTEEERQAFIQRFLEFTSNQD